MCHRSRPFNRGVLPGSRTCFPLDLVASCYVFKHFLCVHDDDDNAICVSLVCTLLEDGTLDWRSSCFLSDILRIIKQAMEQRGVFRLQRIYRVRTLETLIEIYGDFTSGGECLEICRHPSAERAKKDRIRLWMAHQVLFGFLSRFTLANFVRSHRAAPGGHLPCQRKPSGGSILGSGPLAMTLTGGGTMCRWRALSILFHGPFCHKLLVYAVARNRT